MLQTAFHAWERRLANVTTDRVVRPFEWGLDWIPTNGHPPNHPPLDVMESWVAHVMHDTDAFFTAEPTREYRLEPMSDGEAMLTFPSAMTTPHLENNTVYARYFPRPR